jgi:hypothetical protein
MPDKPSSQNYDPPQSSFSTITHANPHPQLTDAGVTPTSHNPLESTCLFITYNSSPPQPSSQGSHTKSSSTVITRISPHPGHHPSQSLSLAIAQSRSYSSHHPVHSSSPAFTHPSPHPQLSPTPLLPSLHQNPSSSSAINQPSPHPRPAYLPSSSTANRPR